MSNRETLEAHNARLRAIIAKLDPNGTITGDGSADSAALVEIAEELGDLAPTLTISFSDYYGDPMSLSGSYRIGEDGESVYFESVSSISIGFVLAGNTIYLDLNGYSVSASEETNCTAEFDYDTYCMKIVPTAEGASVKLSDQG